jgi:hypothetical protein
MAYATTLVKCKANTFESVYSSVSDSVRKLCSNNKSVSATINSNALTNEITITFLNMEPVNGKV